MAESVDSIRTRIEGPKNDENQSQIEGKCSFLSELLPLLYVFRLLGLCPFNFPKRSFKKGKGCCLKTSIFGTVFSVWWLFAISGYLGFLIILLIGSSERDSLFGSLSALLFVMNFCMLSGLIIVLFFLVKKNKWYDFLKLLDGLWIHDSFDRFVPMKVFWISLFILLLDLLIFGGHEVYRITQIQSNIIRAVTKSVISSVLILISLLPALLLLWLSVGLSRLFRAN